MDADIGVVAAELSAKFQDELGLEKESAESEKVPESVQTFLDSKVFDVSAELFFLSTSIILY